MHIFQLSIAALVPIGILLFVTANWDELPLDSDVLMKRCGSSVRSVCRSRS